MGKDMTVSIENGYINIRVGAIIMKEDKVLMVGNENSDYLYSVGGRVKFGETAEEAIVREVQEETGVKLEIEKLGFIHENYFKGDSPTKFGKLIYEISFFFYMKTPPDFEPTCSSFTEDKYREHLIWIPLNTTKIIYPEFFRQELKNPSNHLRHFITDER